MASTRHGGSWVCYVPHPKALIGIWINTSRAVTVALKISTPGVLEHEAAILQTLSSPADNSHPSRGKKHVLQLLDHFQIQGPNGTHDVLVTDVLVPMQYLNDFHIMDPKKTSYETLLALAYLSEHGVTSEWSMAVRLQVVMSYHGDTLHACCSQDLHADNIMFFSPGLAELTVQDWMHTISWISSCYFEDQSDYLPKYQVEAADLTDVVKSVMSKHGKEGIYAVVIDFGSGEIKSNLFGW